MYWQDVNITNVQVTIELCTCFSVVVRMREVQSVKLKGLIEYRIQ